MRLSRRGWATALVGLVLLALGILVERPLLLVGGALVGAGLVGQAYTMVRAFERTLDELVIEHATERPRVVAGRRLAVTLAATLQTPSPLHLAVASRPPPAAAVAAEGTTRLELPVGATSGQTTYLASWPHAGRFAFDPPTVLATDRLGLFEADIATGPQPTLVVAPRTPREIHVGAGGEAIAAYGEHAGRRSGSGFDPAELREYRPGDPAGDIDWKVTARLAEPYVREYERETDRRTLLIVDHRAPLALGPTGETKLDYLREVALALLSTARDRDDPLGCYTVGAEGLTGRWRPDAGRRHYVRIERHLAQLVPSLDTPARPDSASITPARATRVSARLETDDSRFGRTLRPYFERPEAYVDRVAGDPLFQAVRDAARRITGPTWTVLLTDDSAPARLRQTVNFARRREGHVLAFLTPTVLFEPGSLAELEAAYDRYVRFEDLRRSLDRMGHVEAYEVAPGDRLRAVLATGRARGKRPRTEGR